MIKSYSADPALSDYVARVFGGEDEVLADIRARSRAAGLPEIQVGRVDGLHLEVFARAIAATKAVEIGTLGGYSGVCLLRGMAPTGTLYTFEAEEHHAVVARRSFEQAGFADRARLFVGAAAERLGEIEGEGPFDLVFIDADKLSYPAYLGWAAKHLRVGGVLLADNAFLFGRIDQPTPAPEEVAGVRAMQSFNEALARGGRFRATLLPTGEGLAMGVKIR
ncbi:MAG: O-methyltransferase [Myxococcales bacterium]|nr:O-methyltransferase [Myxococcales bacterium]